MDSQQKGNIISDFVRQNLSPRPPERTRISKAYEFLSSVLPGKSFQTGSYARHTSTTPVHDLDVIFVLPETLRKSVVERRISPEELTVTDILQDLATALQKEYGEKAKVKVQPHSVGIFFQSNEGFSIDVVPAQPTNGEKFLVPETALRSVRARRALYESKQLGALRWIKSHPKGYIDQASRLDDVTNGYFRKTAKIVKKWKARSKELNNVFPLKSFHVEIVLTEIMKANPKSPFHSHLHSFFEAL